MHDVGKIGIPDSVLQKPGKLTYEEFEVMKKHPEIGGGIIQKTFGHLDDENYENMAYKIAMCHHEKWNGKGYPNQLSGLDIPLCARIMAVADVFDAISADRCYRKAMPLDTCYSIIQEGRGTDFDPDVVDAFFLKREKIEKVYNSISDAKSK
jgi:HD-GYP domain-containing protein (c-di-GMP phosphodiesterase class II)